MAVVETRVRLELPDPSETEDLAEALHVRGFRAQTVEDDDALEVVPSPDDEELWNLEFVAALESWLEETGRSEVRATVRGRAYTIRARRPDAAVTAVIPPAAPGRAVDLPIVGGILIVLACLGGAVFLFVVAALQNL